MKIRRLPREYPNYDGVPVPFHELELPPSAMNLELQESFNNHHGAHTARMFGRTAISQTFRDLAIFQDVIPKDTHSIAHYLYEPIQHLPDLVTMLDIIDEQRMKNGLLRYGSARNPTYKGITDDLYHSLMLEYNDAI